MKDKLYNCFYSAFRQSHEARISCAMKDKLYNCFYSAFRQSHDAHISAHLERHRPPALLRQPRRPLPTQHFILRIPICVNAGSRAPAALLQFAVCLHLGQLTTQASSTLVKHWSTGSNTGQTLVKHWSTGWSRCKSRQKQAS